MMMTFHLLDNKPFVEVTVDAEKSRAVRLSISKDLVVVSSANSSTKALRDASAICSSVALKEP